MSIEETVRPKRKMSFSYIKQVISGRSLPAVRSNNKHSADSVQATASDNEAALRPACLRRHKKYSLFKIIRQKLGSRKVRSCPTVAGSTREPSETHVSISEELSDDGAISHDTKSPEHSLYSAVDRPFPQDARNCSLAVALFKLADYGWYWGPITREEAEAKLADQPEGAFLVRDSSSDHYLLSLSFRNGDRTLHTRIEHSNGYFSFYANAEPVGFASVGELIEHSMSFSQSTVFYYLRAREEDDPVLPVQLTKPVSRFTHVRTLQYLCRFVIRQYIRVDNIQKLPLPNKLKGYIEERHY